MKVLTLTEINSSQKSYYFLSNQLKTDSENLSETVRRSGAAIIIAGSVEISGLEELKGENVDLVYLNPKVQRKEKRTEVIKSDEIVLSENVKEQISEPRKIEDKSKLESLPIKKIFGVNLAGTPSCVIPFPVKMLSNYALIESQKLTGFINYDGVLENSENAGFRNESQVTIILLRGPPDSAS